MTASDGVMMATDRVMATKGARRTPRGAQAGFRTRASWAVVRAASLLVALAAALATAACGGGDDRALTPRDVLRLDRDGWEDLEPPVRRLAVTLCKVDPFAADESQLPGGTLTVRRLDTEDLLPLVERAFARPVADGDTALSDACTVAAEQLWAARGEAPRAPGRRPVTNGELAVAADTTGRPRPRAERLDALVGRPVDLLVERGAGAEGELRVLRPGAGVEDPLPAAVTGARIDPAGGVARVRGFVAGTRGCRPLPALDADTEPCRIDVRADGAAGVPAGPARAALDRPRSRVAARAVARGAGGWRLALRAVERFPSLDRLVLDLTSPRPEPVELRVDSAGTGGALLGVAAPFAFTVPARGTVRVPLALDRPLPAGPRRIQLAFRDEAGRRVAFSLAVPAR